MKSWRQALWFTGIAAWPSTAFACADCAERLFRRQGAWVALITPVWRLLCVEILVWSLVLVVTRRSGLRRWALLPLAIATVAVAVALEVPPSRGFLLGIGVMGVAFFWSVVAEGPRWLKALRVVVMSVALAAVVGTQWPPKLTTEALLDRAMDTVLSSDPVARTVSADNWAERALLARADARERILARLSVLKMSGPPEQDRQYMPLLRLAWQNGGLLPESTDACAAWARGHRASKFAPAVSLCDVSAMRQ